MIFPTLLGLENSWTVGCRLA